MSEARLLQVLIAPHVSEKATNLNEKHNQVVFRVVPDANKQEVKQAIELLFSVKVDAVTMVNVKGKRKNFGRTRGKRSDWKKAYVTLQDGHDIELMAE